MCHVPLKEINKVKNTVSLNSGQIRKHNKFLRNWANNTESDNLANLILDSVITTKTGKVVVKG